MSLCLYICTQILEISTLSMCKYILKWHYDLQLSRAYALLQSQCIKFLSFSFICFVLKKIVGVKLHSVSDFICENRYYHLALTDDPFVTFYCLVF